MMPASVKIFFETEEGFQKRIKEAEKVNQFQNSQVKMFVKKHQELRLKYYRLKKEYSAIAQKEKNLRTAIQEEQAIIAKCKMSYRLALVLLLLKYLISFKNIFRTNVIDPALFVDPVVDMSIDSNSTSEYVTSPFFDNPKSRKVMETTTLSDNMSQMNMNCSKSDNRQKTNSQSQADKLKHQCKQTLPDTRKKLLENTLQHMHNISQNKYTILQRTKM